MLKLKDYAKNPMLLVFMAAAAGVAGIVEDLVFEGLKGAHAKKHPEKYEDDSEDETDETEEDD